MSELVVILQITKYATRQRYKRTEKIRADFKPNALSIEKIQSSFNVLKLTESFSVFNYDDIEGSNRIKELEMEMLLHMLYSAIYYYLSTDYVLVDKTICAFFFSLKKSL
jgi:hypothetical protein